MKHLFTLLLLFLLTAYCRDIYPVMEFRVSGIVSDFAVGDGKLYVGTRRGVVDVFDIKEGKLLYQIPLDPVKSDREGIVPASVLSIDLHNGSLAILSIGEDGFRDIWIYRDFLLKKVVGKSGKLFAKEVRFLEDGDLVVGTFGSKVARYSVKEGYRIFNLKASESTMGDMVVVEGGEKLIFSDEAGAIRLIDAKSGKILEEIPSRHLDKVHHLAFAKGTLVSGGHDRKVGVYTKDKKPYYLKSDFPVFCVGISPDGTIGLYSSGDDQAIQLFDIESGRMGERLVGHRSMINRIKFISDRIFLSSERGPRVLLWHIGRNAQ